MDPRVSQASPRAKVRDSFSKPASPYLHKHLQAQRGLPKQARHSDIGYLTRPAPDDDLFLAEAEADSEAAQTTGRQQFKHPPLTRSSRHGTPSAEKHAAEATQQKAPLGARGLDQHIDKLSKLNFDLKMELFHCRERMAKLEASCDVLSERVEETQIVAKNAERDRQVLLEINEEMVKELEKRDEAVREAVTIICDLEEKLERMDQPQHATLGPSPFGNHVTQRKSARPDSARHMLSPPSSSNGLSVMFTPESKTSGRSRVPSFMCDKKPSTSALRSVYLGPSSKLHAVKSYASLRSQRDDFPEFDAMDSPRLSLLSESSFPSIYKSRKASDPDRQYSSSRERTQQSENPRVDEWIASRVPSTLLSPPEQMISHTQDATQSGDRPHGYAQAHGYFDHNSAPAPRTYRNDVAYHRKQRYTKKSSSSSADEATRHRNMLPPTPESVSTRLLRQSQSSRSSLETASKAMGMAVRIPEERGSQKWYTGRRLSSSDEGLESDELGINDGDLSVADRDSEEDGYDYPNGGSIVTGTPSRFQAPRDGPLANNLIFDGEGIEQVERPSATRRNTGTDFNMRQSDPRRKTLPRSETTPALLGHGTYNGPQKLLRVETSPSLLTPGSSKSTASRSVNSNSPATRDHQILHAKTPDKRQQQQRRRLSDRLGGVQQSPSEQTLRQVQPSTVAAVTPKSQSSAARAQQQPSTGGVVRAAANKLFRRMSDSTEYPSSAKTHRSVQQQQQPTTTSSSPGIRRPKTAHQIGSSTTTTTPQRSHNSTVTTAQPSGRPGSGPAGARLITFVDDERFKRPSSRDSSDLALVAASQALAGAAAATANANAAFPSSGGRRQSFQPQLLQSLHSSSTLGGGGPIAQSSGSTGAAAVTGKEGGGGARAFFRRAGSVRRS